MTALAQLVLAHFAAIDQGRPASRSILEAAAHRELGPDWAKARVYTARCDFDATPTVPPPMAPCELTGDGS